MSPFRNVWSAGAEHAETTQGRLYALNLNTVTTSLVAVGAILVSIDSDSPWDALSLALGLAAALTAVTQGAAGRLSRVALPCLAVTAVVWLLGALLWDNASGSYGFAVVATLVVHQLSRHRTAVTAGLIAFAAAVPLARLLVREDILDTLVQYVLVSSAVALVGVVLTYLNQLVRGLVAELAAAREREAELAVAQERMRFASDLHDIQGHTLHVVKLKTALARKLVRADPDRAEEELGEIQSLVGDTITQTRELAHAQRRLNLSAELENAKNLFEAADIDVRVDREAEAAPGAGELLGQVLRETTTNILRHAQASRVRITLTETGITIVNDGAAEEPPARLRGLATLRERVADSGGELTVEHADGRFTTAAEFPRPAPERPTTTRKDDR
ncbi:sensor histidine kinase [Nocardiopsis sp. RV163]|uniref:sensor histidine kinase n=1 Tax=Nocardiopsis sp. RV163 TaxID=1661388 RepID=UPI00064BB674|nr:histidine kinase [Nocardiopsis sp. RV163]